MALIRKKGRKTWIYQTKINGKTWCRSTGETDRRRAEAKVAELRKLAQLHRDAPNGSLKLNNAIVREVARIETDVSERQAARVDYALRNFAEWASNIDLERIDTELIEEYQRKRLTEAARTTVDKEICYLSRLLRQNKFFVTRPSAKIGKSTPNRPFTKKELANLFKHTPESDVPLYATLLMTGARPAELLPSSKSTHKPLLKVEVDFEKRTLTIRSAKNRPGSVPKVRLVGIPDNLLPLLKKQIRESNGPFVFEKTPNPSRLFDRVLKQAGIPKVDELGRKLTLHSFRHTYVTIMAESVGHNPFILKELLGHKRLSTTEQYCHPQAPILPLSIDLGMARGGQRRDVEFLKAR